MNDGGSQEMLKARRYRNLILAAFAIIGVAWSVWIPTFEAVDEEDHLRYIFFIVKEHRLPVVNAPQPEAPLQGHQAPAYHLLMAGAYRALFGLAEPQWMKLHPAWDPELLPDRPPLAYIHGDEERFPFTGVARMVHVLRLGSVAIGVACLWFLYRGLAQVFPLPSVVPLVALGWAAFLPGFACACSRMGNDCLAAALGAAMLGQAASVVSGRHQARDWALFGLLAGLGTLAKLTVLPVAVGAVVTVAWFGRRDWRQLATGLGCFAICFVAVSGWWFWRNYSLYGDPMAISMTLKASKFHLSPWTLDLAAYRAHLAFQGYWGCFGHHSLSMSRWIYRAAYVITLLWLAAAAWRAWRQWPGWSNAVRGGVCVLLVAAAANVTALIRFALFRTSTEGRYLLPTLAAHALIVGLAMTGLGAACTRRPLRISRLLFVLSAGLGVLLLVFNQPVLAMADWLIKQWVQWKPRYMTLEFYLEQGRLLYRVGVEVLLGCAAFAGALWAWQVRQTLRLGEEGSSRWWKERRFELALGWAAMMVGFNIFSLVKYVLPVCR
ncbi:MAG: glycosyltransferase family 39 protein [Verrucomicrobia bacterium]|nr:glycosyltransferase family 39 protein [Verrucomicrobiota bacterium]